MIPFLGIQAGSSVSEKFPGGKLGRVDVRLSRRVRVSGRAGMDMCAHQNETSIRPAVRRDRGFQQGLVSSNASSHNGAMAFTRRSLFAVTILGGAAGALAAQTKSGWKPLFDGQSLKGWKETPFRAKGEVHVKDATIVIGKGHMTGITWTGEFPKSAYEVRFKAARLDGNDFFAGITFPVNDSHCTWINGGWGGSVVGLSSLDGDDASENDTSTVREFVKGQWYAFRLEVTEKRIRGWIDEALVIDADITGRRVGLRDGETELCIPLGFATYSTTAGLRNVEYRLL